uniref:Uncharacterized protein n=2 Tax=Daucus carota subsp. sativus TaxID=79200 RepID=A0A164XIX8_DAUCS|nr:PREDICTED: uncharacterized protein LOC108222367 [Daucus carota subsp. sativus]
MVKRVAHRTWNPPFKFTVEEPPPSPPHYCDPKVDREEVLQNNELSLEKKFCLLVGIPWSKVRAAQKYRFCHENVLNWDDSGAKDALFVAHERFCSMINSLPCEHPLPDPDMYIDNIDWNPEIDPGLISELEKESRYHDVEENSSSDKILGCDENRNTVDNPLESHLLEDKVDIKDSVQGRNNCGAILESKNTMNLWEHNVPNSDESTKEKRWKSSINKPKPSDRNKVLNDAGESTKYKSDCVESRNRGALPSKSLNEKGLGDALKNPGGVTFWNSKPNNLSNQNKHSERIDSGMHSRACCKREEYQDNTRSRRSQKREGADPESLEFREKGRPQRRYNLRSSKY